MNFTTTSSSENNFFSKLSNENLSKQDNSLERFQNTCLTVLNSIAPLKREFIRANQTPFMNKELQQTIMIRSRLRNTFLKSRSLSDKKAYNKQKNTCVSLLIKTKRPYYANLNKLKLYSNLNSNVVGNKKI